MFSRAFFVVVSLLSLQLATAASIFNCVGGTVYIIAHADDDLLFQSPDLYSDVKAGGCITTVLLTFGDSGTTGTTYGFARESGNQAAYAQMAGVNNTYTEVTAKLGGQPVTVRTLKKAPRIQRVYFRLPDGNMDGSGYAITGYESLRSLYFGSISSITNQPKTATFTLATLKQALSEIITARQPSRVRTLDYMSDYDAGDHADHLTTARLANEVAGAYASNATLAGYMGYPVQNFAPTLATTDSLFTAKTSAFFSYSPFDSAECQSWTACVSAGRGEAYWLQRQYVVTEALAEQSYLGSAEAPVTIPNGTNIARVASVTASSDWPVQPASAAIDGNIRGYPGNSSAEWSSYGQGAGAWILLTWPQPYTITNVVLYDRPNLNDWMTSGTLTFTGDDNDATISFGALANDGSATLIDLQGSVVTNSIFLYVGSVSSSTGQVGLAEFQVYGTPCTGCAMTSNLTGSTTKTSSGTSSATDASTDLALNATATASSGATDQGASKAIDGWISGYKEDGTGIYSEEWASSAGGIGTWLNLQWQNYWLDRPNLNDQVVSGTVVFSDGTSEEITSLENDGSATIFNLSSPVNTTSLLFTVTGVSDSTGAVGLSELAAFYSLPQTPVPISTSNSTTTLPVAGDLPDETWEDDLALMTGVVATASSLVAGQDPGNAINGVASGYKEDGTGDAYQEWATSGEKSGAWILLTFPTNISVSEVSLYDRPNLNDQCLAGTLTFSDGSFVSVGALTNDGSATNFSIPSITTTSILYTITSASTTTSSVGLAEFAVYGSIVSANGTVTNSTSSTNSTATSSAAVSLATDLSKLTDLAMSATATASGSSSGQGPDKAIDGYVDGYKESGLGSPYEEWASGQTAPTLTLTWPSNVTITGVALFDRPNLNDQITSGTLKFDSGNVYKVGSLPNAGTGLSVGIANETTSKLVFTVTGVSSTTSSAGLAEIAVYGATASSNSTANSTVIAANSTSSAAVSLSTQLSKLTDLAMGATVTASGYATGQGPERSIDGYVDGYKEDGTGSPYEEWASGQKLPTLTLTWPSNITVTGVALFDRPNLNDQITAGTLKFDSGNIYKFGSLPNAGTGLGVDISNETTSKMVLTVTSVSSTTSSAGLAEIAVYGSTSPANTTVTNSTIIAPNSTLSASVPLSTQLSKLTDLAMNATAVASGAASGQGADKAIDGYVDGYKESGLGSPYEEWASGQTAPTLTLTWPSNVTITGVALFDRPNLNDQITSATLSGFASGNVYTVGSLPNDGSGLGVAIANETTTRLVLTVKSVSSTTSSAGLAEIAVYGYTGVRASLNDTASASSAASSGYPTASLNSTASRTANSSAVATGSVSLNISRSAVPTGAFNSSLLSASASGYPSGSGYNMSAFFPSATANLSSALPSSTFGASSASGYNYSSAFPSATASASASTSVNSTISASASGPVSTGAYNGTISSLAGNSSALPSSANYSDSAFPTPSADSSSYGASSYGASSYGASSGASATALPSSVNGSSSAVQTGSASYNGSASYGASSADASSQPAPSSSSLASASFVGSSSGVVSSAIPSLQASSASSVSASSSSTNSSVVGPVSTGASGSVSASASASSIPSSSSVVSSSASGSALASSTGFTTLTRSSSASSASSTASSSSVSSKVSSSSSSSASSVSSKASSSSSSSVSSVSSTSSKASSASSSSSSSSSSKVSTSSAPTTTAAPSTTSKVSSSTVQPSSTAVAVTTAAATVDIARVSGVVVTASSYITKSPPSGAVDGKVGGLSALGLGTASQEWVASSAKAGEWIQITLPAKYLIREVDLYSRVSVLQGVTSGYLSFNDDANTIVKLGALSSSGSAVSLGAGIVASTVRLTVTGTTLTTTAIGLSEFQLWNRAPPTTGLVGSLTSVVSGTLTEVLGLLGL